MIGQSLKNLVLITACCALGAAIATAADSPRGGSKSIVFQGSRTTHALGAKHNRFAIMGQVARPGAYEIDHAHPEMLELIRAAGGLTDGASGALRVIRQGRPGLQAFYSPRLQYELLPGDLVVADRAGGGSRGAKHMQLGQFQNASATGGLPSRSSDAVQVGLVQLADYPLVMHVPSDQPTLRTVLLRLRQTLPADATVSVIKAGSRPEPVSAAAAGGFELTGNTVLVFDRKTIDLAALPELPQPVPVSAEMGAAPVLPVPGRAPERTLQGMPVVRPGTPGGPMLSPNPLPLTAGVIDTAHPVQSTAPEITQVPPAVPMPVPEPSAAASVANSPSAFGAFGSEQAAAMPMSPQSNREKASSVDEPLDPLEPEDASSTDAVSGRAAADALSNRIDEPDPQAAGGVSAAEVGVEAPVNKPPAGSSPLTVFLIACSLFGAVLLVVWNVNRPRTPARPAPAPQRVANAARSPAPIAPPAPVAIPVAASVANSVALPEPMPVRVTEVPAAPQKTRGTVAAGNPLDAIIENRLSIDVEPLVLPSQLPIYGRPVSEPSFRLDAGHEQGTPHFGAGRASTPHSPVRRAQRVRTERTSIAVRESTDKVQAAAPATRPAERTPERPPTVTPAPLREPHAPKVEATAPPEIGLLDRVLTTLHEQKP